MVTVINVHERESKEGKGSFLSLELQGDPEIIQSANTGSFYVTARKAFMLCTLPLISAKAMIGKQLPGSIQKVETEAYDYTVPESGEVIELTHTYRYVPEGGKPAANLPETMEIQ